MKEKLLKPFENVLAKGEFAHYEKFLLLTHVFKNSFAVDLSLGIYIWERVNDLFCVICLFLSHMFI